MILQTNVYVCENPGCGTIHSTTTDQSLYNDPIIQLPEGWGEDAMNRLCCPDCFRPTPSEPLPPHLVHMQQLTVDRLQQPCPLLKASIPENEPAGRIIQVRIPDNERTRTPLIERNPESFTDQSGEDHTHHTFNP